MSARIDHIRAMNVDELAELLDRIADDAYEFGKDEEGHPLDFPCSAEDFREWLLEDVGI
jgi:hypothetical protein